MENTNESRRDGAPAGPITPDSGVHALHMGYIGRNPASLDVQFDTRIGLEAERFRQDALVRRAAAAPTTPKALDVQPCSPQESEQQRKGLLAGVYEGVKALLTGIPK